MSRFATSSVPRLRLVAVDDGYDPAPLIERTRAEHAVRDAVIRENRVARNNPSLDPADPRWVLAAKAYAQLQGTTMTPERRRHLLEVAKRIGVRPFDANLVIAIAQDNARRGRPIAEAQPVLKLLAEPGDRPPVAPLHGSNHPAARWILATLAAMLLTAALIGWLLS